MRSKQHKGFGPPPTPQQVERGINKLFAQRKLQIEQLRESLKDSASRGQIDAIFGQPCASDEPHYHNAYLEAKLAMVQAPAETIQLIKQMRPLVKELLEEVNQSSVPEGGGCHAAT